MFENEVDAKTYALETALNFGAEFPILVRFYKTKTGLRSREEINKLLMAAMKNADKGGADEKEDPEILALPKIEAAKPKAKRGKTTGIEIREIEQVEAKGGTPKATPPADLQFTNPGVAAAPNKGIVLPPPQAAPVVTAPAPKPTAKVLSVKIEDGPVEVKPPALTAPVLNPAEFPIPTLPEFDDKALSSVVINPHTAYFPQQIKNLEAEIGRWEETIAQHRKSVVSLTEKAARGVSSPANMKRAIAEIAATGLWDNFEIHEGKLWFTTAQDTYLTFGGKTLKFGRYAVGIGQGNITIAPFRDNIYLQECYHPFISGGNICWGAWQGQITNELQSGNLVDVAISTHLLLNTYGPDGNGRMPMRQWIVSDGQITKTRPASAQGYLHPMQVREEAAAKKAK